MQVHSYKDIDIDKILIKNRTIQYNNKPLFIVTPKLRAPFDPTIKPNLVLIPLSLSSGFAEFLKKLENRLNLLLNDEFTVTVYDEPTEEHFKPIFKIWIWNSLDKIFYNQDNKLIKNPVSELKAKRYYQVLLKCTSVNPRGDINWQAEQIKIYIPSKFPPGCIYYQNESDIV
jgi:hypothetical protein